MYRNEGSYVSSETSRHRPPTTLKNLAAGTLLSVEHTPTKSGHDPL